MFIIFASRFRAAQLGNGSIVHRSQMRVLTLLAGFQVVVHPFLVDGVLSGRKRSEKRETYELRLLCKDGVMLYLFFSWGDLEICS